MVRKNGLTEAYFEAYLLLFYSYHNLLLEGMIMKQQFTYIASRIDSQKVRLAFFVLTLVLFILGAGAPEDSGGFFH